MVERTAAVLFGGIGGYSVGNKRTQIEYGGKVHKFKLLCSIDYDPVACRNHDIITGEETAVVMDLFTREQYIAWHGHEPPPDVKYKTHLLITEKKTGKRKQFLLNEKLQKAINKYTKHKAATEYLFASERYMRPITRVRAYQIINGAARQVGLTNIGTHTLRKTFGYHFYQRTKDLATLQMIFNHSAPAITLRYIGINQDLMDAAVIGFNL